MTDPDEVTPSDPRSADDASLPASEHAPSPLPVAPRARPATAAQRRDTAEPGSQMSVEKFVSWLGGMPPDGDHPDEEAEKTRLSRETRKFKRTESAAAKAARVTAAQVDAGSAAAADISSEEPPIEDQATPGQGSPRTGDGAIIAGLTPRVRRVDPPASNFFSGLVGQCIVLMLMGLCYVLGRMTLPARVPAAAKGAAAVGGKEPVPAHGVSGVVMGTLDEALAALSAGNLQKARQLLEQLRSGAGHVNGLDFELGWLAYQRGDYPGVLLALNRSIAEGEEVGASYDLRGVMAGQRRPGAGGNDFEAATQARPLEATAFFHWGEMLRRSGKPREALVHLRQSLDRAQTPAVQSLYALKIRLAQIELGQEKDFAPASAAALALPQPVPEWLLTAAAQEMHAGNYAAAAAHLESARQLSGPAGLGLALQDYFFFGYADKPELRGIYTQILGKPVTAATASPGVPAVALPSPIAAPNPNRGPG